MHGPQQTISTPAPENGGGAGFSDLFGPSLNDLAVIAPSKPQEISELGVSQQGGSKAAWIQDMFRVLPQWPRIDALIWFNLRKQSDWRIESSTKAARAFARGAASSGYGQRTQHPGIVPASAAPQSACSRALNPPLTPTFPASDGADQLVGVPPSGRCPAAAGSG